MGLTSQIRINTALWDLFKEEASKQYPWVPASQALALVLHDYINKRKEDRINEETVAYGSN